MYIFQMVKVDTEFLNLSQASHPIFVFSFFLSHMDLLSWIIAAQLILLSLINTWSSIHT